MTFLNPALLWALPLALAPVLIYFLMRYRSLRVVWGANYVLERALARLRRRVNIEQILLIVLRTLAAAALVLAFARPAARRRTAGALDSGIHHVVLVDASGSMQAGEPGDTRWSRGLELLTQFAGTWARGERWSLCRVADTPEWVVDGEALTDPDRVRTVLAALAPGEGVVSWARSLPAILARLPAAGVELTLLTDDQASAWADIETAVPGAMPVDRAYWLDLAQADHANGALLSARLGSSLGLVGHPLRLYVEARHFGTDPVERQTLDVLLDGALFAREAVAFLPGQTRALSVDVVFASDGDHTVTARLGKDPLLFDNAATAGVAVRATLKVAVPRDPGRTGTFHSLWPLLEYAARQAPVLEPVQLDGEITPAALAGADIVILDGGRTLTPALCEALRDYALGGGCLLLAPDATTDRDAWTRLFDEALMPLPAPLSQFRSESLGGDRFQSLPRTGWPLSALKAFETVEDGDVERSRIYAWQTFGERRQGVEAVGVFADGTPLLLRHAYQPGAVFLLAAGLSGAGGNLAAREFYVPWLLRLLTEAASAAVLPRVATPDQPARLAFRPPTDYKGLAFQLDRREPVGLTPQRSGDWLVAQAPAAPGAWGTGVFLVLRDSGIRRVGVGLQGDRPESDLTPIDDQTRTFLADQLGLERVAGWPELEEKVRAAQSGGEYHLWVILVLLLLLVGEMVLERRFV